MRIVSDVSLLRATYHSQEIEKGGYFLIIGMSTIGKILCLNGDLFPVGTQSGRIAVDLILEIQNERRQFVFLHRLYRGS